MKKLIVTLGIFLSAIICVQAQDANIGKQADNLTTKITNACHLSPDQQTKIKPFVMQFLQARNQDKQKYANDQGGLKNAIKADRMQFKSNLQTVLTPEQMTELKNYFKQQREMRKKQPAPAGNE